MGDTRTRNYQTRSHVSHRINISFNIFSCSALERSEKIKQWAKKNFVITVEVSCLTSHRYAKSAQQATEGKWQCTRSHVQQRENKWVTS